MNVMNTNSEAGMLMKVIGNYNSDPKWMLMNREIVPMAMGCSRLEKTLDFTMQAQFLQLIHSFTVTINQIITETLASFSPFSLSTKQPTPEQKKQPLQRPINLHRSVLTTLMKYFTSQFCFMKFSDLAFFHFPIVFHGEEIQSKKTEEKIGKI